MVLELSAASRGPSLRPGGLSSWTASQGPSRPGLGWAQWSAGRSPRSSEAAPPVPTAAVASGLRGRGVPGQTLSTRSLGPDPPVPGRLGQCRVLPKPQPLAFLGRGEGGQEACRDPRGSRAAGRGAPPGADGVQWMPVSPGPCQTASRCSGTQGVAGRHAPLAGVSFIGPGATPTQRALECMEQRHTAQWGLGPWIRPCVPGVPAAKGQGLPLSPAPCSDPEAVGGQQSGRPPAPLPAPIFRQQREEVPMTPPPRLALPPPRLSGAEPPTQGIRTLRPGQVRLRPPTGKGGGPGGSESRFPTRLWLQAPRSPRCTAQETGPPSLSPGPVLQPVGARWLCAHGRAGGSWQGHWPRAPLSLLRLEGEASEGDPSHPPTHLSQPPLCLAVCVWGSGFAGRGPWVPRWWVSREGQAGPTCGGRTCPWTLAGAGGLGVDLGTERGQGTGCRAQGRPDLRGRGKPGYGRGGRGPAGALPARCR